MSSESLLVILHWAPAVTGKKNSNHRCRGQGSNPGHLSDRHTLNQVGIKTGLYSKAVQVCHILSLQHYGYYYFFLLENRI